MDNQPKSDLLGKVVESLANRVPSFLAFFLLLLVVLALVYLLVPEVFSNISFWTVFVILLLLALILGIIWDGWESVRKKMGRKEGEGSDFKRGKIFNADNVKTKLNTLAILLQEKKWADASRFYIDFIKRPEPHWQSSKTHVQKIWNKNAPWELKILAELWLIRQNTDEIGNLFKNFGVEKVIQTFQWALNTLDDDWEQKVRELTKQFYRAGLFSSPEPTKIVKRVMREDLRAIFRPYSAVTFHKESKASIPDDIRRGLDFLGLQENPFGAERAEKDTRLFKAYYPHLPALQDVREEKYPAMIFGKTGSGKTAAALWLINQGMELIERSSPWFPVYCPITTEPDISVIAHVVAEALLGYLAINTSAFIKLRTSNCQSIVHLWINSVAEGDELFVLLREAEMPLTGMGAEMEKIVRGLMKGISRGSVLTDNKYLSLLDNCKPYGFESVRVFLDWDLKTPSEAVIPLAELSTQLANVGVFVSAFVAGAVPGKIRTRLRDEYPEIHRIQLDWNETHLKELLRTWLTQCGYDSIASWCDPVARRLDPDDRLIQAADKTPRGLIRKGNALLRRIGGKQAPLLKEDLDRLLPPQSK